MTLKELTEIIKTRGPWYKPLMPVGRELTGAEWMEWSKAREGVK